MKTISLIIVASCLVSLSSANAAQTTDVWKLANNDFDTVMSLPRTHPTHYALAFGFSDEIASKCAGLFSPDFKEKREIAQNAYGGFSLYSALATKIYANQIQGRGPASTSRLLSEIATGFAADQLPFGIARRRIDSKALANAVIAKTGGCESMDLKNLAVILEGIGTFGTLPSPPDGATEVLKRHEITHGGQRLSCFYLSDKNKLSEKKQEYLYPTATNIQNYLTIPLWTKRNLDLGSLDELSRAMRFQCPQTVDADQGWTTAAVRPNDASLGDLGGSRAVRIANYFIDIYVPSEGEFQTRYPLTATREELEALRQEIIKLESLSVSDSELDREYEAYALRDKERCPAESGAARCTDPKFLSDRLQPKAAFAAVMQFRKYREIHGSIGIFSMEAGHELMRKGVPQYVYARSQLLDRLK